MSRAYRGKKKSSRGLSLILSDFCASDTASPQPGLFSERDEQPQGLIVDAIFREIEVHAGGLCGHPLAARRIIGKQAAQVRPLHHRMVVFEIAPYRVLAS